MAEDRNERAPATGERKEPAPAAEEKGCADRPRPTDGEIVSSGGSIAANSDC
ncbi:hypothetical protein [Arenibaculum sp.]|jgi:hypothetical protein|uniref:hypothetical protein n=1 Tax=Arenibaculum sp. TaxID=2865862 RepID=UPI002E138BF0|nr:hypothetical protein [Arenibaculum sp.]